MSVPFRIDVITIFPEYLAPLRQSLLGKAAERGLLTIGVHDLRQWTDDVHRTVDDAPYGGGPGMVMKPEPWGRALEAVRPPGTRLVVPTPAGQPFTQALAAQWATEPGLVFACGRYEGIDQRVPAGICPPVRCCQTSSVTNGMKGWRRRRLPSSTPLSTRGVARLRPSCSARRSSNLAISMYQSQYSPQMKSWISRHASPSWKSPSSRVTFSTTA